MSVLLFLIVSVFSWSREIHNFQGQNIKPIYNAMFMHILFTLYD